MTSDLEGLPADVRYSLWVLKLCDRWHKFPDEVEERGQELLSHLENENLVQEALKRHRA